MVTAVLEALSAPAGAEDTRTRDQRYHDALEDAMRRLVASGLLPERAGQPVKVWAHVSLAELRALDDGSVLAQEWIGEMAVRWAARRAAASQTGGDGAAWLDGSPPARWRVTRRLSRWSPAESTPAPWMTWWPCACNTPATARTAPPGRTRPAGSPARRPAGPADRPRAPG